MLFFIPTIPWYVKYVLLELQFKKKLLKKLQWLQKEEQKEHQKTKLILKNKFFSKKVQSMWFFNHMLFLF